MSASGYLTIKAVHVAAVVTWISCLVCVSAFLAALPVLPMDDRARKHSATLVRQWDRRVGTSAMLAVWSLGFALVWRGNWLGASRSSVTTTQSGWLASKLALVLLLSAVHGVQAGALRRLAGGTATADIAWLGHAARVVPSLILISVTVIALLVVTKPF